MVDDGREGHEGRWGWVVPAVLHEKEQAHKASLGSLHLVGSVFICNILSMGCIL